MAGMIVHYLVVGLWVVIIVHQIVTTTDFGDWDA